MALKVAVIDYGMGNIGSICKMLRLVGAEPMVSSDPDQLKQANKLVLPGVGHFDRAMANLESTGLAESLRELVQDRGMPILGICLGMQLFCQSSEEGSKPGLGYLNAHVRRFTFPPESQIKVPHMGWRGIGIARPSEMLKGFEEPPRFYFAHSYFIECFLAEDIVAQAEYGRQFVAAFVRGAVWGVQFHPEKSHRFGVRIFENFVQNRK